MRVLLPLVSPLPLSPVTFPPPIRYLRWMIDMKASQPAKAIIVQRWWRRRKQRKVARAIHRMAKLLEYKVCSYQSYSVSVTNCTVFRWLSMQRREYDWDCMTAEDRRGEGMREVEKNAIFVQKFWRRRVKLRAALREIYKYDVTPPCFHSCPHLCNHKLHASSQVRDRDGRNVKTREIYRWGIDTSRYTAQSESKKVSAAIVIQSLIRRFLERSRWDVHIEAKRRQVCSTTHRTAHSAAWACTVCKCV